MKCFDKRLWMCAAVLLGGCTVVFGEGKIYVWNGSERPLIVTLDGRTDAELALRPGTGQLVAGAVPGGYAVHVLSQDGAERQFSFVLDADKLAVVSAAGAACFARTDITGMYQPGKHRVTLVQAIESGEMHLLDDVVHVYPGEPPPPERPRSAASFQRLYEVPCDLVQNTSALEHHLRERR